MENNMVNETVLVLGASANTERYSYRATKDLMEAGHKVIPVSPRGGCILGVACLTGLDEVVESVDTLTMYVGAARSTPLIDQILRLKPGRIIFNPGSENKELEKRANAVGIETMAACTLVLIRTGQF